MTPTTIQSTEKCLELGTQRADINNQPGIAGAARSADLTVAGQAIYVPAGTGRTYKSPIDRLTFLATSEQTGGTYFLAEVTVPPGGGNPPHIHSREEEAFYLKKGTLTILVGDKTLNALAGDFVQLPRGVAHCFQNTGTVDAKFLVMATPAGLEKFFEEAFYPSEDWPEAMPPMSDEFMSKLLMAAAKCGLSILPPA